MSEGQRRIFPEAFKREAVARVSSSGLSVIQVAGELGVHGTVLRRWYASMPRHLEQTSPIFLLGKVGFIYPPFLMCALARLSDGPCARPCIPTLRSTWHGGRAAAPSNWLDPSFRSRHSICRRGLSADPGRGQHHALDEPQGQLLGYSV
jgi:hypothetical protein